MKIRKNKDSGFSLVELIVVIVILAILIGVTITGVMKYVTKARKNIDIQNCETLQSVLWDTCGTAQFPKLGYPWSYITQAHFNDGYENVHGYVVCCGETEGRFNYSLDGQSWHVNRVIDQYLIKRDTNKERFTFMPFECKSGGNMYIVVSIDAEGNCTNIVVGFLDNYYGDRGMMWQLGMLYNPDIETTETHKSCLNRVKYDGVYKFYED